VDLEEFKDAPPRFTLRVQTVSPPPSFFETKVSLFELQAARRRTSQTVAAIRIRDDVSSQPPLDPLERPEPAWSPSDGGSSSNLRPSSSKALAEPPLRARGAKRFYFGGARIVH
jgi:hypothetical protein